MVKKLIRNLFLHSAKRTFFVVGGLIALIGLPITLFLSQQSQDLRQHASGGCTYRLVGKSYLCVANEGASSATAPIVPENTSVTEGNINYYGTNGPIIELPNIINLPASNYESPAPTKSPEVVAANALPTPKASTTPTAGVCKQKCSIEGEKARSADPSFYYICKSSCFDNTEKCPTNTIFNMVAQKCIDPNQSALALLVDTNNRDGIKSWASSKSIAEINNEVSTLTQAKRDSLASVVLDTNVSGADRDRILVSIRKILNNNLTGFYTEIFSYTRLNILSGTGGGLAYCNKVDATILDADPYTTLDTIMHESLHSFNCTNGGPSGALNEGSAIWIFKLAFPGGRSADEMKGGFAEATYGTVNYYRDNGVIGNNFSPLNAFPSPNAKSAELFRWLSGNDPSRLPWDNQQRIQACYDKYYKNLKRNDNPSWFAQAAYQSSIMASDTTCGGIGLSGAAESLVVAQNKCNNQNCCTTEDKNKGMICVKPAGVESCGCPTSWACEYIGRQNTDTSQTVRCVPPVGGGIAEGNACSPAGAQCGPTKVGTTYYATECLITGPSYTCVRSTIVTPSPTTSSSGGNTSNGGNTGIYGGRDTLACDPVKDGVINSADYDLWLKEYTHKVNTTQASCFVPGDNTVNILDFQVWKDIKNNLRQSF